jgi:hypothetical protein
LDWRLQEYGLSKDSCTLKKGWFKQMKLETFWLWLLVMLLLTACKEESEDAGEVMRTPSPPTIAGATVEAMNEGETAGEMGQRFEVRSVDFMKLTQDLACEVPPEDRVDQLMVMIAEMGATHVAISLPSTSPEGCEIETAWRLWLGKAREYGLKVFFRTKPLEYEGFHGADRILDPWWHIDQTVSFVISHPSYFESGDLFGIPEPQNAGIEGVNYCPEEACLFTAPGMVDPAVSRQYPAELSWALERTGIIPFNEFLIAYTTQVRNAFQSLGLEGIEVGYFGFDGFVAIGDRNPDWQGILSASMLEEVGNVGLDHYFPTDADPEAEWAKFKERFPQTEVCITEWGPTEGQPSESVRRVLEAALKQGISCFNWWQAGATGTNPEGKEALFELNEQGNVVPTEYYQVLKEFYQR